MKFHRSILVFVWGTSAVGLLHAAEPAAAHRVAPSRVLRPADAEMRTFGLVKKYPGRPRSVDIIRIRRTPPVSGEDAAPLNRFVSRRAKSSATLASP